MCEQNSPGAPTRATQGQGTPTPAQPERPSTDTPIGRAANALLDLVDRLGIEDATAALSQLAAEREAPYLDCQGSGKCHGTLSWCQKCGDVGRVCDMDACDVHGGETPR